MMFETTPPNMGTESLALQIRSLVDSELESGERLLWAAQPRAGLLALKALPISLFGIPFAGFALFWMWGASGFGHSGGMPGPVRLFPLFGLPFLLIGLGMVTAPLWAFRSARRTAYAVTEQRAIIFSAGLFGSLTVRSFGPGELQELHRRQRADGYGDLVITREISSHASRNSNGAPRLKDVGFLGVPNVKDVEAIVRALAETGDDSERQ